MVNDIADRILPASVALAIGVAIVGALLARRAFVVAQPDEWLLRIRNGKLLDAGIGISLWRWVSIGEGSPAASVATLVAGVREVIAETRGKA